MPSWHFFMLMTYPESKPGIDITHMHKGDRLLFAYFESDPNNAQQIRAVSGDLTVTGHGYDKEGQRRPIVDVAGRAEGRTGNIVYRDIGLQVLLCGAYDPETRELGTILRPGSQLEFTELEDAAGSYDTGIRPQLILPLMKIRHPDNSWWITP